MQDHSKVIQETLKSIGFDKNKSYPHKYTGVNLDPQVDYPQPVHNDLPDTDWYVKDPE
jgi:hypothetical protein